MTQAVRASRQVWTEADIRALGVRMDGVLACKIVYDVERTRAYELLAAGDVDFRVLRRGRRYIVPTIDVLRLLGLEPERVDKSGTDRPASLRVVRGD